MRWAIVRVFVIGLLVVGPLAAQEEEGGIFNLPTECDDENWAGIAETVSGFLDEVSNAENKTAAIIQIQVVLQTFSTACSGYVFTSDDYGLDWVSEPFAFNDGVYRMVLESEGAATVDITEIEGRCGDTYTYTERDGGIENSTSTMDSCIAVLEVDADTDWTLTYEPLVVSG